MPDEIKEETTNAVLKEMIIGLTKITDERFSNMKESMTDIKIMLQGFATKLEMNESKNDTLAVIKEVKDNFAKHYEEDVKNFNNLTRIIYIGMGGLTVITFFIPIFIHYFWK